MSAKKLRSKLDIKFRLPLSTSTNRSPPPSRQGKGSVLGISPDFSDKMFRKPDAPPPPPPPPKDKRSNRTYSLYGAHGEWDDVRYAVMASPISESPTAQSPPGLSDGVIVISRQVRSPPDYSSLPPIPDEMGVVHRPSSPRVPPKASTVAPHSRSATSRIPIAASRVTPAQRRVATISTPEEADLRRREAQRRKEQEEQEAAREEALRQARLKQEKQQEMLEAEREEAARKAALEQELRHAAEERRKRLAIEQEAEALSNMVAAERKRQEKERRRQEALKQQQLRAELEERRRSQERERMSWRERIVRERRARVAKLEAQKTKNSRGLTVLLTGWLTVQSEDYLSYKRRYFQLREDALLLYKDAEVSSIDQCLTCPLILKCPGRFEAAGDDSAFPHSADSRVAGRVRGLAGHSQLVCPRNPRSARPLEHVHRLERRQGE